MRTSFFLSMIVLAAIQPAVAAPGCQDVFSGIVARSVNIPRPALASDATQRFDELRRNPLSTLLDFTELELAVLRMKAQSMPGLSIFNELRAVRDRLVDYRTTHLHSWITRIRNGTENASVARARSLDIGSHSLEIYSLPQDYPDSLNRLQILQALQNRMETEGVNFQREFTSNDFLMLQIMTVEMQFLLPKFEDDIRNGLTGQQHLTRTAEAGNNQAIQRQLSRAFESYSGLNQSEYWRGVRPQIYRFERSGPYSQRVARLENEFPDPFDRLTAIEALTIERKAHHSQFTLDDDAKLVRLLSTLQFPDETEGRSSLGRLMRLEFIRGTKASSADALRRSLIELIE